MRRRVDSEGRGWPFGWLRCSGWGEVIEHVLFWAFILAVAYGLLGF